MGIDDSKIMITGYRIYHSFMEKNTRQAIPESLFTDLYNLIQKPEEIYLNTKPEHPEYGSEYHFSKVYKENNVRKILNVVLRKVNGCALRITTIGFTGDGHRDKTKYRRLWHGKN
jgi:hypothetical protein